MTAQLRLCTITGVQPAALDSAMDQKEGPFKPGDAVALASGGPGLTVIDVGRHSGLVFCRWAGPDGFMEGGIAPEALVRDPRDHFGEP